MHGYCNHITDSHIPEGMVCGYEVRTSCEVSSSVTSDGTASVSTAEAVCNNNNCMCERFTRTLYSKDIATLTCCMSFCFVGRLQGCSTSSLVTSCGRELYW